MMGTIFDRHMLGVVQGPTPGTGVAIYYANMGKEVELYRWVKRHLDGGVSAHTSSPRFPPWIYIADDVEYQYTERNPTEGVPYALR